MKNIYHVTSGKLEKVKIRGLATNEPVTYSAGSKWG